MRDFSSARSTRRRPSPTAPRRSTSPLFRRLGDLGVLGITVPERFGGAGMDAVAAVIVHEELAAADPGFTLAYLAHAMLFVNNLAQNASDEQRARYLPDACSGRTSAAWA